MERKLIVIENENGQGVQMYEDEARVLGLLVEKKQMPKVENKAIEPKENKAAAPDTEPKRKPVRK